MLNSHIVDKRPISMSFFSRFKNSLYISLKLLHCVSQSRSTSIFPNFSQLHKCKQFPLKPRLAGYVYYLSLIYRMPTDGI